MNIHWPILNEYNKIRGGNEMTKYLYEYTKEETEDPHWKESLGKLFRYQYGCNGCGGSFDPSYGGEIEEETGRLNMCGSCLDKGITNK